LSCLSDERSGKGFCNEGYFVVFMRWQGGAGMKKEPEKKILIKKTLWIEKKSVTLQLNL